VSGNHPRGFAPGSTYQSCSGGKSLATNIANYDIFNSIGCSPCFKNKLYLTQTQVFKGIYCKAKNYRAAPVFTNSYLLIVNV